MIQTLRTLCRSETIGRCGIHPIGPADLGILVGGDVASFEPLRRQLWQWWGGPLIGSRLIWSDGDPIANRYVAILSSRLPRGVSMYPGWRLAFRSAMLRADALRLNGLTSDGTTSDGLMAPAFVNRGLQITRIRRSRHTDVATWLRLDVLADARSRHEPLSCPTMAVSPRLDGCSGDTSHVPFADCLLAALADEVYVLHARSGGGISRLLTSAFRSGMLRTKRVYLARGHDLVPDVLVQAWRRDGGIDWQVLPPASPGGTEKQTSRESVLAPILLEPPSDRTYLAHWTRPALGAWPDESDLDYADTLLSNVSEPIERTSLTTLKRILHMQKLVATSRLTRGMTKVVCLTSRSVELFPRLRCYRRHQRRWDFECYGLAIALDIMIARGARPVIYGDDGVWTCLSRRQRPFFQPATGRDGTDWRQESEWRVVGDVCLRSLKIGDAFLFVPRLSAAIQIAAESRWPVVVVPPLAASASGD